MPPPDLISLFIAPLNATRLTYMVTGAVAATIYGEPRLTNDIDVVVALREPDAVSLAEVFGAKDYYVPPMEVIRDELIRPEHGHFNIIHVPTALKADIYPSGDDPLHHWALPRRRAHSIAGETVWVAPLEYVVVRKLQYARAGGSDKHLRDIRAMLRLQAGAFDRADLLAQVARLSLEKEWAAMEASPGE